MDTDGKGMGPESLRALTGADENAARPGRTAAPSRSRSLSQLLSLGTLNFSGSGLAGALSVRLERHHLTQEDDDFFGCSFVSGGRSSSEESGSSSSSAFAFAGLAKAV